MGEDIDDDDDDEMVKNMMNDGISLWFGEACEYHLLAMRDYIWACIRDTLHWPRFLLSLSGNRIPAVVF